MKKYKLITIGLLSSILSFTFIGCKNNTTSSSETEQTDENNKANEEIKAVVERISAQLPAEMGNGSIDKVEFIPDKGLYIYMTNQDKNVVKKDNAELYAEVREQMKSLIIKDVKRNKMWAVFRKHSVTIHYKMNDTSGEVLFDIVITPEDYK